MEKEIISLLFPEGLLDFFEVQKVETKSTEYIFYLDEKNIVPSGYEASSLESKGFYDEESMTDFPLRGKRCTLKLRRRKWIEKSSKQVVKRNWSLVAKGTRTTEEFAAFLKELNR